MKENQDMDLITESAVLKINESSEIRELYRALCEIQETAKGRFGRKSRSSDWAESNGGIQEVNSDGRIDQLEALRFNGTEKVQFIEFKSGRISENEMPGTRKETPKEETRSKYPAAVRGVGIGAIGKHGAFLGAGWDSVFGNSGCGSLIGWRFVYTVGNMPISAGRIKAGAYVGGNRKLDARFPIKGPKDFRGRMRPHRRYNYRAYECS